MKQHLKSNFKKPLPLGMGRSHSYSVLDVKILLDDDTEELIEMNIFDEEAKKIKKGDSVQFSCKDLYISILGRSYSFSRRIGKNIIKK